MISSMYLWMFLALTPVKVVSTSQTADVGTEVALLNLRQHILDRADKICRDYLDAQIEGFPEFPEWKKGALVRACKQYLLVGRRSRF